MFADLAVEKFAGIYKDWSWLTCSLHPWFLYYMVAHFTLRTYDRKIEFDDSFDENKCLQQIEMPDLLHVCAE